MILLIEGSDKELNLKIKKLLWNASQDFEVVQSIEDVDLTMYEVVIATDNTSNTLLCPNNQ